MCFSKLLMKEIFPKYHVNFLDLLCFNICGSLLKLEVQLSRKSVGKVLINLSLRGYLTIDNQSKKRKSDYVEI